MYVFVATLSLAQWHCFVIQCVS